MSQWGTLSDLITSLRDCWLNAAGLVRKQRGIRFQSPPNGRNFGFERSNRMLPKYGQRHRPGAGMGNEWLVGVGDPGGDSSQGSSCAGI